jgi:hypothetical protein
MYSEERLNKYQRTWIDFIKFKINNKLLDYNVLLYSVEQKCFHEERLIDYITCNIIAPDCEFRLVSPPFKNQEENDEYCKNFQKEIKEFCDDIKITRR